VCIVPSKGKGRCAGETLKKVEMLKVRCPHRTRCVVHTKHGALSTQSMVRCPHRARCVDHTEQGALSTQSMVRCTHRAWCVVHTEHGALSA